MNGVIAERLRKVQAHAATRRGTRATCEIWTCGHGARGPHKCGRPAAPGCTTCQFHIEHPELQFRTPERAMHHWRTRIKRERLEIEQ